MVRAKNRNKILGFPHGKNIFFLVRGTPGQNFWENNVGGTEQGGLYSVHSFKNAPSHALGGRYGGTGIKKARERSEKNEKSKIRHQKTERATTGEN